MRILCAIEGLADPSGRVTPVRQGKDLVTVVPKSTVQAVEVQSEESAGRKDHATSQRAEDACFSFDRNRLRLLLRGINEECSCRRSRMQTFWLAVAAPPSLRLDDVRGGKLKLEFLFLSVLRSFPTVSQRNDALHLRERCTYVPAA